MSMTSLTVAFGITPNMFNTLSSCTGSSTGGPGRGCHDGGRSKLKKSGKRPVRFPGKGKPPPVPLPGSGKGNGKPPVPFPGMGNGKPKERKKVIWLINYGGGAGKRVEK